MSRPLRIAQLTPYYHPSIGGVEGVVRYLSEELVRRGHSVDVLTANRLHRGIRHDPLPREEIVAGVRVRRFLPLFTLGHMSVCPGEVPALWKGGYDLLHTHVYRQPQGGLASAVGTLRSIPTVLHGHGPFDLEQFIGPAKRLAYRLYDAGPGSRLLRRTDHIIALTEGEKGRYAELGVDPGRIDVVPNAADGACFEDTDPLPFIRSHGLEGRRIILFMGILTGVKRPDLLVRALPRVRRAVPETFLVLAGPDTAAGLAGELERLARTLGVERHVKWVGPLRGREKHQAYAACELFALPSDWDPLPLVIPEAMAHGRPVVGSDASGPAAMIVPGETGLIVPKGDVEALAAALLRLLQDPPLARRLGERGRAVARERYTVGAAVDQIEAIYSRLGSRDGTGRSHARKKGAAI